MLKIHNNNMKNNRNFIYILIIFFIISINSIYSFSTFLTSQTYSLVIKQSIFYLIGIFIIIILLKIKPEVIFKYAFLIYFFNLILLILVLIIGVPVNGTKAWFNIPFIGTFQPSEFMKIGIILYLAKIIDKQKINSLKGEIVLIIKAFIIVIIPSIITFLEPDTGAVIIYFIITFIMLFTSKIRIRWFLILFVIIFILGFLLLYFYMFESDIFIKFFGDSMFYRFDRIFDWQNSSGMQLENSLISIGSSGYLGNGISNILLYFPEGHTDFIFSSIASIYGLVGMFILIFVIMWFDLSIIMIKTDKNIYRLFIYGFLGALFYQQIQNISMTIGLMPITGITLPFISYGGSSLISYMILLGISMSINNNDLKIKKDLKVF